MTLRVKQLFFVALFLISACSSQSTQQQVACPSFTEQSSNAHSALLEVIQLSREAWNEDALVERLYENDIYVYIAVSEPKSTEKIKMASYDYEFDSLDEVLGKSQFFFPSIADNVEVADPSNFSYEGNGIRASLLDSPDTQFNYFFTVEKCLVTRIEYQIPGGFDLKLAYTLDEEAKGILQRANSEL
ncbi:MAG: hypothetical protein RIS09_845 [Actinomycetota bacterium]|jgi:hypothetical protein